MKSERVRHSDVTSPPIARTIESATRDTLPVPLDLKSYILVNEIRNEFGNYIRIVQSDTSKEVIFTYGVFYNSSNWKIGYSTVRFIGTDIIEGGVHYEGAPDLFEL